MNKKVSDKIAEDYALFNIPKEQIPAYENPYQFSTSFKKCSLTEFKSVTYSNTTACFDMAATKK